MKPAKIHLLEPQFLGYTGILCGVYFKDGISVAELPFLDQQRICASMRAETIDGQNVSPSAAFSNRNELVADQIVEPTAPDIVPMKRGVAKEETNKCSASPEKSWSPLLTVKVSPACARSATRLA